MQAFGPEQNLPKVEIHQPITLDLRSRCNNHDGSGEATQATHDHEKKQETLHQERLNTMNWFTIAQIPVLLITLWLFTVWLTQTFPTIRGKRIILLIAHPDDEAMFFAPTVQWLTRPELQNQLVILCLSSGDADGLGHIRKGELKKSALQLGVKSEEHVVIVEDEKFPDSMTVTWDAKFIGSLLARLFAPNISNTPSTAAPKATIDIVITFDAGGVSGHPNHISLFHGATTFIKNVMQRHAGWKSPVQLYTLTTTNILRKYTSVVDAAATIITCIWRPKERGDFPSPLVFVSGPMDVRKAQRAMTTAHKSQMRWFRWGWIGLSRYMVINDLTKAKIA